MRQDTSTVPLSTKHSVHRHAPSRHSRAHGKPFIHMRRMPRFENALTAIDNIEHPNSNTGSKAVTPNHNTRYKMGPRAREDDKIRDRKRLIDQSYKEEVGITKMRQDTSTAPLSHKHSAHSRHGPQLSFPCTRETIQPHAPDAAFGNILTEIDNIEQSNINTGNEAVIPSHTTCYTMGPRLREDDEIRDKKKLTSRS